MFTAIVITPEKALGEGLERLAVACKEVTVYKTINHYPSPFELTSTLNSCDPDLVFLDLSEWDQVLTVVKKIHRDFPKAAVVGFGGGWVSGNEDRVREAGLAACLVSPIGLQELQRGVTEAMHASRQKVHRNLVAFLPAKAGSGCSLAVLNVAAVLAGQLKRRVLVIDGDLHSGVLGTRWDLSAAFHFHDVLKNPDVLSRSEWPRFVVQKHGVDLLLSGGEGRTDQLQWSNYYHLLEFVAREYDEVIVDLPEVINDATAEVVQRATSIQLVMTPQPCAVKLAQRRIEDLTARGVDPPRISLVLNRSVSDESVSQQIAEYLGHRISAEVPDEPSVFDEPDADQHPVDLASKPGSAWLGLAGKLAGVEIAPPPVVAEKPKSRLAAILGR